MIIAVDFDGVLCENKYPKIGPPIMENINRIKKLQKQGEILILWTCRRERYLDEAIKWCKSFDLKFNYINENTEEIIMRYKGDSRKIFADYYIDDKNLNTEGIDKFIESYNNALKCLNHSLLYDKPISKEIKDVKELKHMPHLYELYDEVNTPLHYIHGRKFEPAFVINDWGVNWYVGTCIKYLSRMGRKDDSDKEISKALWYIIAEIANNHKDIPKEKLLKTIDEIYSRKEKYEQLKKE